MKKISQPTAVADILSSAFKTLKSEGFKIYPIWKNWDAIVGPHIASNTEPQFLEGKVLTIGVKHPVWITELTLQKKNLLESIKKTTSEVEVDDIRFKLLI